MPKITDPPPLEIAGELAELRAALDKDIPAKALDHNLLIATWNIRAFGNLTEKWRSGENDSPKRDLHALRCIAEIVSRFDVIALQELEPLGVDSVIAGRAIYENKLNVTEGIQMLKGKNREC